MPKNLTMDQLIDELASLDEMERLALCDALVDNPDLRDLLETIDDYLYLESEENPPPNFLDRDLN